MKSVGCRTILSVAMAIVVWPAFPPPGVAGKPPGGGSVPPINTRSIQTPPVKMGTSGGWSYDLANGYCCGGTLGSLVEDANGVYLLSNFHVLAGDTAAGGNGRVATLGDPIVQPGLIDTACRAQSAQVVGYLGGTADPFLGANIDAALAFVASNKVDMSGAILGIGTISSATASPRAGQLVKKTGRTTGLTRSRITAVNATIRVSYDDECAGHARGTVTFLNQIVVENKGSRFLAAGDSGSLMVEDVASNPRAVGLLFAGSSSTGIANPIGDVLTGFGVTMRGVAPAAGATAGATDGALPVQVAESLRKTTEALHRHADRLQRVPEWTGHGAGIDEAGRYVIKVFVERVPAAARAALPSAVDGIPVEVEEIGRVVAF